MQFESFHESLYTPPGFLQRPLIKCLTLVMLFISALGIRLYHITKPPLDFAPIRQYQNAHNARAYYFNTHESISENRKKIADINAERMGFSLEPRIMESMAVFAYRIAGGEKLWIPRVFSLIFWIIGGLFLFLIAKKLTGLNAALFSTFFYLFLPYAILASRSFQPDPLMIMMLIISIYAIFCNHEQPSKFRLLLSALVSAIAIFIKPYCVFLIFCTLIALSIKRQGIWKSLYNTNFILFSCISLVPAFIYYGYSSLFQGDAQAHIEGSFFPHLLLRPYFWKDWLTMIGRVTGYLAFAGALMGLLMSRGQLRTVLSGLWSGYFVFGLVFTFHIHTHEYYQLQLIPIEALSIIPVASMIISNLPRMFSSKRHVIILTSLCIALILSAGYAARIANLEDYKKYLKPLGAVIGVHPQFYKFVTENFDKEVRVAQEIGEIVGHRTDNVYLTNDFGRSLAYHGELSGLPWPTSNSLRNRKERDIPIPDKGELFTTRYLTIRTYKADMFSAASTRIERFIQYTPGYFIVTAFEEFDKQPDLKDFLYANFPVLAQSEDYLIFDLRKMSE